MERDLNFRENFREDAEEKTPKRAKIDRLRKRTISALSVIYCILWFETRLSGAS